MTPSVVSPATATAVARLTKAAKAALEAARYEGVRFRPGYQSGTRFVPGRYEVRTAGVWRASKTAATLAQTGLLRVSYETPGAHYLTLTEETKTALGIKCTAVVLALELGATIEGLTVSERTWNPPLPGTPERTPEQVLQTTPDHVLLTGDARHYDRTGWCTCQQKGSSLDSEVYFERWTPAGREGHGWLHRTCRRLTQAG